jgi:hypothetical protein
MDDQRDRRTEIILFGAFCGSRCLNRVQREVFLQHWHFCSDHDRHVIFRRLFVDSRDFVFECFFYLICDVFVQVNTILRVDRFEFRFQFLDAFVNAITIWVVVFIITQFMRFHMEVAQLTFFHMKIGLYHGHVDLVTEQGHLGFLKALKAVRIIQSINKAAHTCWQK